MNFRLSTTTKKRYVAASGVDSFIRHGHSKQLIKKNKWNFVQTMKIQQQCHLMVIDAHFSQKAQWQKKLNNKGNERK